MAKNKVDFINDEAPVSHFTVVPNMIDDSGLSAPAIRFYLHLRRVAGNTGKCWQSQDTLAEKCSLSKTTVVKYKRELAEAGFIKIGAETINNHKVHVVTIVNIWPQNLQMYRDKLETAPRTNKVSQSGQTRDCNNNPIIITSKEEPVLSRNPKIAEMQQFMVVSLKTDKDLIPNPAKEAKYIDKMLKRGYNWEEILHCWSKKVEARMEFVSMQWVNEDIGKKENDHERTGKNRSRYQPAGTDRLKASVGAAID